MRSCPFALVSLFTLVAPSLARAEVSLLLNDSFVENGSVGFQQGFAANEAAGVTLGPVSDTFTIQKVQFLFGPTDPMGRTVTVQVYVEDTPSVLGEKLHEADYQISPSSDALHVIDLSTRNVVHNGAGSIRVVVKVNHNGAPGVARDDDGCTDERNWIFTNGAWTSACDAGVTGDWIIRAEIDGPALGEGGGGAGGAPSTTTSTSVTSGGASGGSGGAGGAGGDGDVTPEGGCNCRTASDPQREGRGVAIALLGALLLAGRRQSSSR